MNRHHVVVRVTHWVNVVALGIMVGSGLRIFNAYPRFAPRGGSFCCYPFEGQSIPEWLTFGGWLAGARNWHFAMMWVLVVNGLVYLAWIYLHGEWRELVPRRGDPREMWQMARFYLFLRPSHPPQAKHNALQKISYFAMPLVALLAVLSGLAIWKPVSLGWLTAAMGGYVWARYWHFLAMVGLVLFTAIHVMMVIAVDPYSMRAIVTGGYDESRSPVARNARPLGRVLEWVRDRRSNPEPAGDSSDAAEWRPGQRSEPPGESEEEPALASEPGSKEEEERP